ncbi:MAG: hypothetical protein ACO1OB_34340 [Archangium sp.]
MSVDQESVPALQKEVAQLWEAYRRGADATPLSLPTEDTEALRSLERRHAELLSRRDVLRAGKKSVSMLPRSAVLGAIASVIGTVVGAALCVWATPMVAAWSADGSPEFGLGIVAASLVGLVISLRRV